MDGGNYRIESTTDFAGTWTTNLTGVASQGLSTQTNLTAFANASGFRVALSSLAAFDPVTNVTGTATTTVPGGSASRGSTVTVSISLPTMPPWPPANAPITSVTLAGTIYGTALSDTVQGTVLATFAIPANAPTGAQTVVVKFNFGPTYTFTGGFTIN